MLGYFLDENGYINSVDFITSESTGNYTTTPVPSGLNKPKWDGENWVEGMTNAERDEIHAEELPPTENEVIQGALLEKLVALQGTVSDHNDTHTANNALVLSLIAAMQAEIDALKGGA